MEFCGPWDLEGDLHYCYGGEFFPGLEELRDYLIADGCRRLPTRLGEDSPRLCRFRPVYIDATGLLDGVVDQHHEEIDLGKPGDELHAALEAFNRRCAEKRVGSYFPYGAVSAASYVWLQGELDAHWHAMDEEGSDGA